MARFASGTFQPKNPQKLINRNGATYRSSWELNMMMFFDNNQHVKRWGSEVLRIKYRHPIEGRIRNYIPDFFVVYIDKAGKEHSEVIEVKPRKQTIVESRSTPYDRMAIAVNHSKWQHAQEYCRAHGFTFRVINEDAIFHRGKGK